jgi:hypothetical protein
MTGCHSELVSGIYHFTRLSLQNFTVEIKSVGIYHFTRLMHLAYHI